MDYMAGSFGFLVIPSPFYSSPYSPAEVDRIWGIYRDNVKDNGNYYVGFRVYSPP